MKIIHTFCLLLLCFWLGAQSSNWSVALLGGIDWNKSEYTYSNSYVNTRLPVTFPKGNSLGIRLRKRIDDRLSFSTGLAYSKRSFYPRLSLGFYGSIIVDPLDTTNVLRFPYLKEHRFSLIQVPVYLHYQFSKNGKVKPYMNIGFVSDFKFNEFERYQDDDTSQGGAEHLEFWAKDSGLDFFSLAFNLGLGLSIAMGDNLSLLIEHSGNIWEYRKGNEKFKENGEMLFESKILALSRLSLNLGVAYKF